MTYLNSPAILYTDLPAREQEYARRVSDNLNAMHSCVRLFRTALELADFCDANRPPVPQRYSDWAAMAKNRTLVEWKMMAGRDAAITLANYVESKKVINSQIAPMPIADEQS